MFEPVRITAVAVAEFFRTLFRRREREPEQLIFAGPVSRAITEPRKTGWEDIPALLKPQHGFVKREAVTVSPNTVYTINDEPVRLKPYTNTERLRAEKLDRARGGDMNFHPGVIVGGAMGGLFTSHESFAIPPRVFESAPSYGALCGDYSLCDF